MVVPSAGAELTGKKTCPASSPGRPAISREVGVIYHEILSCGGNLFVCRE